MFAHHRHVHRIFRITIITVTPAHRIIYHCVVRDYVDFFSVFTVSTTLTTTTMSTLFAVRYVICHVRENNIYGPLGETARLPRSSVAPERFIIFSLETGFGRVNTII